MKPESFPGEASGRLIAIWLIASAALAFATGMTFIRFHTWAFGRSFVFSLMLLALAAVAWRNRSRPVLEITDAELRWAPIFRWSPKPVALSDIEHFDEVSPSKVVVSLRSGRKIALRLSRIAARHREHALNALKQLQH